MTTYVRNKSKRREEERINIIDKLMLRMTKRLTRWVMALMMMVLTELKKKMMKTRMREGLNLLKSRLKRKDLLESKLIEKRPREKGEKPKNRLVLKQKGRKQRQKLKDWENLLRRRRKKEWQSKMRKMLPMHLNLCKIKRHKMKLKLKLKPKSSLNMTMLLNYQKQWSRVLPLKTSVLGLMNKLLKLPLRLSLGDSMSVI
jgi:hypothetical protein